MEPITRYTPALIPVARTLAERGALERDLAAAFGVHFKTIRAWKQAHPDFAAACRLPDHVADAAVERALFRKATGYDRESERVFWKDGALVRTTVTEHVPPCDKAATFWLRVRRPERWGAPAPLPPSAAGLTPTEEALRDIEHHAYEAWRDARDGEPAADGDDVTLARIDALFPDTAPADDDGDPLVGLEPVETPPSCERVTAESDPGVRRDDEGGPCAEQPRHERLPHRHHPPLPALVTAPLIAPVAIDSPAPMSKYDPAFIPLARQMAEAGALDRDLARAFAVSPTTLRQWTLRHAAFGAAVRLGKAVADRAVEDALFARATGYAFLQERVFLDEHGALTRTEVPIEQPPSLAAARFWLHRRAHPRWSMGRRRDLDPDAAARLAADTRARIADYDLHRRHWRAHGCAPPGRPEPAPPDWLWDELGYDDEDDWDEAGSAEEDALRARVDALVAEYERIAALTASAGPPSSDPPR